MVGAQLVERSLLDTRDPELQSREQGIITVWLTSRITGLDLAEQVNMLLIKHEQRI